MPLSSEAAPAGKANPVDSSLAELLAEALEATRLRPLSSAASLKAGALTSRYRALLSTGAPGLGPLVVLSRVPPLISLAVVDL